MNDVGDQAIIPLAHIDNYFNLRKVMVADDELKGRSYHEVPSWACNKSVLEIVSGLQPNDLYQKAGIDLSQRHQDILVSTSQCVQLVNMVRKALPFEHLGLVIGKLMTLSHHGQAGIAVMTQDTLADCMKTACRFADRLFPPINFSYESSEEQFRLTMEEHIDLHGLYGFFMEIKVTSFYFILKHLMGQDNEPLLIRFGFPKPSYSDIYKRYFKCPIEFDCARTEIVVDQALANGILPFANRFMAIEAENTLFESLPLNGMTLLPIRLKKLLLKSYGAFPSLENAAKAFGMSGRTLRRKLSEEGSSYQSILNDVRCQLSKDLLNEEDSITEIAFLLGFSDTSAFTKAFRKWTGMSPTEYRRNQQKQSNQSQSA